MLKFDDGGTSPFRRVKYLGEHACPIFESATAQQAKDQHVKFDDNAQARSLSGTMHCLYN